MNLYRLSQDDEHGYDTYDSCIVAAETKEEARQMHPAGLMWSDEVGLDIAGGRYWDHWSIYYSRGDWAKNPKNVTVELIGTAVDGTKAGVVCASFNAG